MHTHRHTHTHTHTDLFSKQIRPGGVVLGHLGGRRAAGAAGRRAAHGAGGRRACGCGCGSGDERRAAGRSGPQRRPQHGGQQVEADRAYVRLDIALYLLIEPPHSTFTGETGCVRRRVGFGRFWGHAGCFCTVFCSMCALPVCPRPHASGAGAWVCAGTMHWRYLPGVSPPQLTFRRFVAWVPRVGRARRRYHWQRSGIFFHTNEILCGTRHCVVR